MMDLSTYLKGTGEKQSDFASRVQTTPATISRICAGTLKPALDLAHRIEDATEGAVPTETWVSTAEKASATGQADGMSGQVAA